MGVPEALARMERLEVDGRSFAVDGNAFRFLGASYGTFAPRDADGEPVPLLARIRTDMRAMAAGGLTIVRVHYDAAGGPARCSC